MHSNGGGEFINKNLDKFLKGKGVKQTVPHTSEHNRVIERMLFWIGTTILVRGSMVCMLCTQLHTHKSSGWCDTNGTLEWCKARCESSALLGANASRWSVVKLRSSLSGSHSVSTWNQQQKETSIAFTMRLPSV
jgi:hypothetical protein